MFMRFLVTYRKTNQNDFNSRSHLIVYRHCYLRHFDHPVIHEQELRHEELLACYPEQWAELVKQIVVGECRLCTSTHKEHYEQKSIMYSTSIKSSEAEHFTLFHCA